MEGYSRQPRDISTEFTGMMIPRRLLVAPSATRLKPGMVVKDSDEVRYLLGAWSTDAYRGFRASRQFALFECNDRLEWTRSGQVKDPVSGLMRATGRSLLGRFWAVNERKSMIRDAGAFTIPDRRVICGVALQPGDNVDSLSVKNVERMRGLYIAEVA